MGKTALFDLRASAVALNTWRATFVHVSKRGGEGRGIFFSLHKIWDSSANLDMMFLIC